MGALAENVKTVYRKYDLTTYSSGCTIYLNSDGSDILCIISNDKDRGNVPITKIAERYYETKKQHSSIRSVFFGESIKEFDIWLKKHFKLKVDA